ncbi:MAG: hypothetical protein JOZ61_10180 [Verrucomicrobia bacterium]|nr:hypothetical protein [Verrucomicrobiota bacterium]
MTTRTPGYCDLLQEFGFPAVKIKTTAREVIEYNNLFSRLVDPEAVREPRRWFTDCVQPAIAAVDRERWEIALSKRTSVQAQASFGPINGQELHFEMRCFAEPGSELADTTICIFIPLTGPILERLFDACTAKGCDLERKRIRDELHKGISQQILGAAFAWKILAHKIETLNGNLGKEASDLAALLNDAVRDLQNLMRF